MSVDLSIPFLIVIGIIFIFFYCSVLMPYSGYFYKGNEDPIFVNIR